MKLLTCGQRRSTRHARGRTACGHGAATPRRPAGDTPFTCRRVRGMGETYEKVSSSLLSMWADLGAIVTRAHSVAPRDRLPRRPWRQAAAVSVAREELS